MSWAEFTRRLAGLTDDTAFVRAILADRRAEKAAVDAVTAEDAWVFGDI